MYRLQFRMQVVMFWHAMQVVINWSHRSSKTYHDKRLRKVSITWKLTGPASKITCCVRNTNVTAILWTEVHHIRRKLEHEILHGNSLHINSLDSFFIHIRARVVYIGVAQSFQIGQVKANLFFVHDQIFYLHLSR